MSLMTGATASLTSTYEGKPAENCVNGNTNDFVTEDNENGDTLQLL